MENGSDGPGEGGLHGIVGWRLAVDLRDDIFFFQSGFCAGAAGNNGLDLQMVGKIVEQEAGTVEDIGLAIVRVLLEIHFAVRAVEDDRELAQDMQSNVARNGGGRFRALRVCGENGDGPDHFALPSSNVSARV